MLCLDLDRFKGVNDTLGHPIGDALLQGGGGAACAAACARRDTVARLGGDEFAIVQVGTSQPDDATTLARPRLIEAISAPYDLDGHQVVIGTEHRHCDRAGRRRRRPINCSRTPTWRSIAPRPTGAAPIASSKPDMDARMQARRTLELDLRTALVDGEFELYYQPLVDLAHGAHHAASRRCCAGAIPSAA